MSHATAQGSSPLTRGKLYHRSARASSRRLIPAHAGKTLATLRTMNTHAAHPRSRGENSLRRRDRHASGGSSPLTRGKHGGAVMRRKARRAHPRSRGENRVIAAFSCCLRGSSPLTRGKLAERLLRRAQGRLIPAHAGKTTDEELAAGESGAHPRSRGENRITRTTRVIAAGSSPLTRGKPRNSSARVTRGRLIPAHAGKTFRSLFATFPLVAHPRSRGENARYVSPQASSDGSSPLTRGKHFLTCAFTAQIDQILETLELAASFGSYLIWVACATDAPQDPVRSIGLVLPSSMGAS